MAELPAIRRIPRTEAEIALLTQWIAVALELPPTRAERIAFATYWWGLRNPDPARDGEPNADAGADYPGSGHAP